jgi:hypothetical protein
MNAIFVELIFDVSSFAIHFSESQVPAFGRVTKKNDEFELFSLKVVDSSFTEVLEDALKELEISFINEFGEDVNFNNVSKNLKKN